MSRPSLYVLAGVNGAGKSSIGGYLLTQAGLAWFNPDTFARALVQQYGYRQDDANIAAWSEGVRRLDEAVASRRAFAFETTLGGQTITEKLIAAAASHDVMIWYCGLRDVEQHIARVRLRVQHGGHDIPITQIQKRWISSRHNLLRLMPCTALLNVYDNSQDAVPGQAIADPVLVLSVDEGRVLYPSSSKDIRSTPDWAKPLVEAALSWIAGGSD